MVKKLEKRIAYFEGRAELLAGNVAKEDKSKLS